MFLFGADFPSVTKTVILGGSEIRRTSRRYFSSLGLIKRLSRPLVSVCVLALTYMSCMFRNISCGRPCQGALGNIDKRTA
jgi:hypothetical protein